MHGFEDRGIDVARGRFVDTGRFGRMFPELRSLKEFSPGAEALGKAGGPMDAADGGVDNPRIKAGYTFLGQFIDHDLTLDATSSFEAQIDLNATTNFRTPAFELDSIYGRGPVASPQLYNPDTFGELLLSADGFDLPRNHRDTAILGDHRNDENRILGQLHVAFLKFHNAVLHDHVKEQGDRSRFEAAQSIVRWHYQWIVLNEFLPRIVGREVVDAVLKATNRDLVPAAYMPVEFSGAAYRFGHSQVRPGYGIRQGKGAAIFPADLTIPPGVDTDLRGGTPLPASLRIDWSLFFGAAAPQQSKAIDTKLSSPLLALPGTVVAEDKTAPSGAPPAVRSLAVRNLLRGAALRLPPGQTIADFLGIPRLSDDVLWNGVNGGRGLAPLWYYVLREAAHLGKGKTLAGVGAHIVARTFINILLADKASFVWQFPGWKPTLPGEIKDRFTMTDLLKIALGKDAPSMTAEDVDTLP